jgi:hypothetical protein
LAEITGHSERELRTTPYHPVRGGPGVDVEVALGIDVAVGVDVGGGVWVAVGVWMGELGLVAVAEGI